MFGTRSMCVTWQYVAMLFWKFAVSLCVAPYEFCPQYLKVDRCKRHVPTGSNHVTRTLQAVMIVSKMKSHPGRSGRRTLSDLELSNAETWRAPRERAERTEVSQKDAIFDCLKLIEDGRGGELWASAKKVRGLLSCASRQTA